MEVGNSIPISFIVVEKQSYNKLTYIIRTFYREKYQLLNAFEQLMKYYIYPGLKYRYKAVINSLNKTYNYCETFENFNYTEIFLHTKHTNVLNVLLL